MKKNGFKIRSLYAFVLMNLLFWNSVGSAQALFGSKVKLPSFKEIADKAEKRYGFNKNILRNSQKKGNYPQVEIFFSETAPKKGEKVTATTMPKHFKTTNANLYYTWFLFREDEDNMNDAKRLAMGIVARGDFDPFLFNTDYSSGGDDPDHDGYKASFGGGDGVGGRSGIPGGSGTYESENYISPVSKQIVDTMMISRCYRHNFGIEGYTVSDPGGDLIIPCSHKFPKADKGSVFKNPHDIDGDSIKCESSYIVGDGEFTTNEEACWRLDPTNSDTDGDGFKDEADLAGLGQTQFTWSFRPGDRVGVVVEGTSMVTISEGYNNSGTNIIRESIELDGTLDWTENTVTDGGTSSTSASATADAEGNSSTSSSASIDGDSTAQSVATGDVAFEVTSEVIDVDRNSLLNPYYKIAWAGIDFCDREEVEGDKKRNLINHDECESSGDYGFTYLAVKTVFEEGDELLKSNLDFTPTNPQFNADNNDYSDYITINSNFIQTEVDDDFVYYIWDIYYCGEDNLDTCTEDLNNKLTTSCTDGDVLGKCAEGIISDSYAEGLGLDQIRFKLDNDFVSDKNAYDNFYLKAFLKTKKSKNSSKVSITSIDIPIVVDDNALKIFKVSEQADGSYGFNENLDEICDGLVYGKICPVYPGQIIAVKADVVDALGNSDVEAYSWKMNDQKMIAPKTGSGDCSFGGDGCSLGELVYLPISGSGMELQKISLKTKKEEGEEITSERIISVAAPIVKIISKDENKAWPRVVEDGSETGKESDNVFIGTIDEKVSFSANLVPNYLNNNLVENGISLIWYVNGQKIDDSFIADNSDYEIELNDRDIKFKLKGKEGDSINLKVELEKEFSFKEKALLKDNWEIKNMKTLKSEKQITIEETEYAIVSAMAQSNSIKLFTASTLANASEYIIFIIRTSIVFVLFWTLLFGFNYWFNREIKIEKSE